MPCEERCRSSESDNSQSSRNTSQSRRANKEASEYVGAAPYIIGSEEMKTYAGLLVDTLGRYFGLWPAYTRVETLRRTVGGRRADYAASVSINDLVEHLRLLGVPCYQTRADQVKKDMLGRLAAIQATEAVFGGPARSTASAPSLNNPQTDELNLVTRLLCSLCGSIEQAGQEEPFIRANRYSQELIAWWQEHKTWDLERTKEALEQAQRNLDEMQKKMGLLQPDLDKARQTYEAALSEYNEVRERRPVDYSSSSTRGEA